MPFRYVKFSIRVIALLCIFSIAISFSSCEEKRGAHALMTEFAQSYGAGGVLYSTEIEEGEYGYIDKNFFYTLYGEGEDSVSDYSVLLLSGISSLGECAVFICYTDYDAFVVSDMCRRRIDLLRSFSGSPDTSSATDAVVKRYGRCVVMCAMADNSRAISLWDKIL